MLKTLDNLTITGSMRFPASLATFHHIESPIDQKEAVCGCEHSMYIVSLRQPCLLVLYRTA